LGVHLSKTHHVSRRISNETFDKNNNDMNQVSLPKTLALMHRFNDAFSQNDPEALIDLIAPDCVMDHPSPPPNGTRYVGGAACLAFWQDLARDRSGHFEIEDTVAMGERGFILWRYRWGSSEAESVRGVNIVRVRDGQIVEALGYLKAPAAGA
jgi:ketosteroid isomerase-like protein